MFLIFKETTSWKQYHYFDMVMFLSFILKAIVYTEREREGWSNRGGKIGFQTQDVVLIVKMTYH